VTGRFRTSSLHTSQVLLPLILNHLTAHSWWARASSPLQLHSIFNVSPPSHRSTRQILHTASSWPISSPPPLSKPYNYNIVLIFIVIQIILLEFDVKKYLLWILIQVHRTRYQNLLLIHSLRVREEWKEWCGKLNPFSLRLFLCHWQALNENELSSPASLFPAKGPHRLKHIYVMYHSFTISYQK